MSKFNKRMDDLFKLPPSVIEEDNGEIVEYVPGESTHELSTLLDHDLKTDRKSTRLNSSH